MLRFDGKKVQDFWIGLRWLSELKMELTGRTRQQIVQLENLLIRGAAESEKTKSCHVVNPFSRLYIYCTLLR